jgi:iron(III) transport system substrate-binding protein
MSRRQMLRLAGLTGVAALAAACSQPTPPASPTAAPAKPTTAPAVAASPAASPAAAAQSAGQSNGLTAASTAEWDTLVAAAKKEGTINIATYVGTGYRKVMDDFEAAFPGIKVEQTGFQSSSRDFVPRLLQERKAGLFGWDIAVMPGPEMMRQVRPAGGMDPLKPLLIHPDVVKNENWTDGTLGGFVDSDKQYVYGITRSLSQSLFIDTNQIKEGEITGYKDLLDPKWRGKIIAGDPRTKGSGFNLATTLRLKTKDDNIIKELWADQEAVLSTDARQLTEFVARGRYPIGLGAVSKPILIDFLQLGVGSNLKWIPMVELDYLYSGSSLLSYIKNAPHPNAAKVLVNWILTKEGSQSWATNIQENSRRVDVPPFDPELKPKAGIDYVLLDAEEVLPEIEKAQEVAKAVLN